jgi:hypothetical protein
LRALIGAALLREGKYSIGTVTAASLCTGVSRSILYAALTLLQSEDDSLIVEVLKGHKALLSAAAKVRGRARLIEGFKSATVERPRCVRSRRRRCGVVRFRSRSLSFKSQVWRRSIAASVGTFPWGPQ